ncbi:hypothetical protein [Marinimicrobium alkaliphilum]|uniref:hypothetical protein n=1 Tax=Marinimicrobium alkaliphilum TaxID=2202654 RepID=UPI000DB9387F|nr:hypothetical protein [Marinimicrobium alkaliphilum]
MAYLLRFGWLAALALVWGCERDPVETLATDYDNRQVVVRFYGERSSSALFGEKTFPDLIQPVDARGKVRGEIHRASPDWLAFDYQIDGERSRVLVAKQPVMHTVAWWDIARVGAADGDARVTDLDGTEYRVRLLHCGQHTMDELSEWNLLIGGVHQGDMDFRGERYGWIRRPYDNDDLKVGYQGSLNWCQDRYSQNRRVMRGYYFVSRFHAARPGFRGSRVYWRPVLEVVEPEAVPDETLDHAVAQRSPDGQVRYYGTVGNDELFGSGTKIADLVGFHKGEEHETGAPDWLKFHYRGQTLLVAAQSVRHSLSWNALAKAGLVAGENRKVRVGMRRYDQDVTVTDTDGNRYWVRLIQCGKSTLDHDSEWNRLIGGVVEPDGDFARFPSRYGWLDEPFEPAALNLHTDRGAATWCRENVSIYGDEHGINRGFLVPSRFHATPADFTGWGFGWRPVLQLIED